MQNITMNEKDTLKILKIIFFYKQMLQESLFTYKPGSEDFVFLHNEIEQTTRLLNKLLPGGAK